METTKFPAGTYYIGDPCYAITDRQWQEALKENDYFDNHINDQNIGGVKVAIGGTRHGDGCYQDQNGCQYGVDSGTLGIIPIEACIEVEGRLLSLGNIVEFNSGFTVEYHNHNFDFGGIKIKT